MEAKAFQEHLENNIIPFWNRLKDEKNGVMAERTMNTLLHLLESYYVLYRADPFYEVGDSIRNILKLFKGKIYNQEKKICNVFFDRDYHSLINLESFGHDIESSWLIDRGCHVLGDTAYQKEMSPIINGLAEGSYQNGIDKTAHAMNNECEDGKTNCQKIWWVQAEAVTGFYNAYQKNPAKKEYLKISEEIWNYIQKYMIDKKSGEWMESITENNEPIPGQPLVHPWKCPYHNGRMCIEMIQRLSKAS